MTDTTTPSGARINTGAYALADPHTLRPYPGNPNRGDVNGIKASIERIGFTGALIVQKSTGYVVSGNHTLQAVLELGMEQVPVLIQDITDDEARAVVVAFNRLNRLGYDDHDALTAILQDLLANTGSLDGTGYDESELDAVIAALEAETENPPITADKVDAAPERATEYRVIVTCVDEAHQAQVLGTLMELGLQCRGQASKV